MKLNKISYDNFRSKESESYPLGKVNIWTGKNGAGKSTVKSAVQIALTGTNEWVSTANTTDLIRHGADTAMVSVNIDSVGELTRYIGNGCNSVELNRGRISQKEVVKYLDERLDTTQSVLSCVLDSNRFLEMDAKEQKTFLLKACNLKLDQGRVFARLDFSGLDEETIAEATKKIKELLPDETEIFDLEKLEKCYKRFYDARTAQKKAFDLAQKSVILLTESLEKQPKAPLLSAITGEEELSAQKEKLLKVIGSVSAIKTQKDGLARKINDLDIKIKALNVTPQDINVINQQIEAVNVSISELEAELDDDKSFKSYQEGLRSNNKSVLKNLESNVGAGCPLSKDLVCGSDKKPLIEKIKTEIQTSDASIAELSKIIAEKDASLNAKKAELKMLQNTKTNLEALANLTEQRNALYKEYAALQPADVSELEIQKTEVEDKLKVIQKAKSDLTAVEQKEKELEEAKKNAAKLEIEVAALEFLCEKFGPGANGLKAIILKETVSGLEDYVNSTINILGKGVYGLKFDFSNDFNIIISKIEKIGDTERTYEIPYKILSESERDRLGWIMADAINTITNAKILCIDRIDKLDEENAAALTHFLTEISENYDTMLLMGTYGASTDKVVDWVKKHGGNVYDLK